MYKEEEKVKETLFRLRSGDREDRCKWYNNLLSRDNTVICFNVSPQLIEYNKVGQDV